MYGEVTMSDVLNGVVPVKDGFSFARNLVIQLHTKLNLARATEIRRLEGTGKSVSTIRDEETPIRMRTNRPSCSVWTKFAKNGHFQHQSIFTAIHEELAVAMGIIKAKGDYHTGTFDPGGVPGE